MLGAYPWILALDADEAGQASAEAWMSRSDRCVRVPPPTGKDWTEAYKNGVPLREWWRTRLDKIAGRSPSLDLPRSSHPGPATEGVSTEVTSNIVDAPRPLESEPCFDTEQVANWPPDWRERWGARANKFCHEGMEGRQAEVRAAIEVFAEMKAAKGGLPPVMDPDPHTALAHDLLEEMISSGEAEGFLDEEEFRLAQRELASSPPNGEASVRGLAPYFGEVLQYAPVAKSVRIGTLRFPGVVITNTASTRADGGWVSTVMSTARTVSRHPPGQCTPKAMPRTRPL